MDNADDFFFAGGGVPSPDAPAVGLARARKLPDARKLPFGELPPGVVLPLPSPLTLVRLAVDRRPFMARSMPSARNGMCLDEGIPPLSTPSRGVSVSTC